MSEENEKLANLVMVPKKREKIEPNSDIQKKVFFTELV